VSLDSLIDYSPDF